MGTPIVLTFSLLMKGKLAQPEHDIAECLPDTKLVNIYFVRNVRVYHTLCSLNKLLGKRFQYLDRRVYNRHNTRAPPNGIAVRMLHQFLVSHWVSTRLMRLSTMKKFYDIIRYESFIQTTHPYQNLQLFIFIFSFLCSASSFTNIYLIFLGHCFTNKS